MKCYQSTFDLITMHCAMIAHAIDYEITYLILRHINSLPTGSSMSRDLFKRIFCGTALSVNSSKLCKKYVKDIGEMFFKKNYELSKQL